MRQRCTAARACALLALVLCACGAEPESSSAQRVVLGTGEARFEHIEGQPELPLVAGAQGGFHVWASFLAYGFDTAAIDLTLTTRVDGAGEELVMRARLSTREVLDANGIPSRSFAGFPAQVRDARCAHGQRISLQLHVAAPDGSASASDERECIALLEPEFQLSECP